MPPYVRIHCIRLIIFRAPMASAFQSLVRRMERMGYTESVAEKLDGQWMVLAFNPLHSVHVKFGNLGPSIEAAMLAVAKLPSIPSHYVCGYLKTCTECGAVDRPIGYTQPGTGGFIQRCRSCGHEWVALTAAEQLAEAEARMNEALEVTLMSRLRN